MEVLATQTTGIWDRTIENPSARLMRQEALLERAAPCLTQRDNERVVKLGALTASAGKSETMVGAFAAASNDFMTEVRDLVDCEDDAKEKETEDGPTRRSEVTVVERRSCSTLSELQD